MPIRALFLDIRGVLLTNGWDHQARRLAAKTFDLDMDKMEDRHHLTFDTYEIGRLALEQYLSRVVFYTVSSRPSLLTTAIFSLYRALSLRTNSII